MRFFTTLLLLAAVGLMAAGWYFTVPPLRNAVTDATSAELARITPTDLIRLEVADARVEKQGAAWTLPDGWPTRASAVESLIETLSGLQTRFAPLPLTRPEEFGLAADQKPLIVKATVRAPGGSEKTLTLTFGEPPADAGNPFTRPTYLRVDDRNEVLRLAPGLIDRLRLTRTDFQRKQLFPDVVRAKIGDGGADELPPAPVPLLDAAVVSVTGPDGSYELTRVKPPEPRTAPGPVAITPDELAGRWQLTAPHKDRVDPERLRGVLAAIPELWVENFLTGVDPEKTGLENPERTVKVKSAGSELTVQIGKVSRVNEITPPAPPPGNPFAPPPPAPPVIREEYRYAKLPGNEQVFEIKADKFADLFAKPGDLRDPRVARFKPAEVTKVAIAGPDLKLSFAREKSATAEDTWKIVEPAAGAAEGPRIVELLEKLAALQARGPDVIDTTDRKAHGLGDDDPVTTVTLTLGATPDAATIRFRLGKTDIAKSKLWVQLDGQNRLNAVPDDLRKLVDRPALAYRSRRTLDFNQRTLARIAVERPADGFTLAQVDGVWNLVAPLETKADTGKANALAADLSRLEAVEFVNFTPTADDLKNYGLDAPPVKVTLTGPEGARTVHFGKGREGKPEVYAQVAGTPEVFAVRAAVRDAVDQPSLAFRPLQLWIAPGAIVSRIEVDRGGQKFQLARDGAVWKIGGPFSANAFLPEVQPLLDVSASPRAEKFVAHGNDGLANFGLEPPAATLTVTLTPERPDDPSGTRTLLIGKPTADGANSRYGRLPDLPGVFVIPNAGSIVDRTALDLLDRRVLAVDNRLLTRLEGTGPGGAWSARRDGANWTLDSFTPPVAGDRATLERLAGALADIRVASFAAYGPADWNQFGLAPPAITIKATLGTGDQPTTHTIALGRPVDGKPDSRYVRIDESPAVGILSGPATRDLGPSALELADRGTLNFPPQELSVVQRTAGKDELRIERKDGSWRIVKPTAAPADDPALTELAERLGALRAVRVAGLGVKDFKPFGLDAPAATLSLTLTPGDGQTRTINLALGAAADGGRYARVGDGDTVYLIPDSPADPLAARLLAPPIKFRDRTLARFTDADRVTIKRGDRTATFAKVDGVWKMTAPVTADAEAFDLDDLILAATKLRAEEILADTEADAKPLNLDKPEAVITFYLGEKEALRLAVGAKDADGRVTARAGDGPIVGRIDPALSARLLGEYRKRALWPNLDVAQADTLVINAGAGGPPLALNKTDAGWQAPGSPDRAVNVETVSDVLAALAGLKVERYVVDEKADVKLFGLEPPTRVIAVKTRSGATTTLHIGRQEGDSKRVYATVPGSGVVGVLAEADAGRLLKPVADFFKK